MKSSCFIIASSVDSFFLTNLKIELLNVRTKTSNTLDQAR